MITLELWTGGISGHTAVGEGRDLNRSWVPRSWRCLISSDFASLKRSLELRRSVGRMRSGARSVPLAGSLLSGTMFGLGLGGRVLVRADHDGFRDHPAIPRTTRGFSNQLDVTCHVLEVVRP